MIEEIFSGVHHWTALHKGIGTEVHSYYVPESAALIDPMEPAEGLDWFEEHGRPERILLTNRHHYRDSGRFADRFGCRVLCHRAGLHEFEGGARGGSVLVRRRGRARHHGGRGGRDHCPRRPPFTWSAPTAP